MLPPWTPGLAAARALPTAKAAAEAEGCESRSGSARGTDPLKADVTRG